MLVTIRFRRQYAASFLRYACFHYFAFTLAAAAPDAAAYRPFAQRQSMPPFADAAMPMIFRHTMMMPSIMLATLLLFFMLIFAAPSPAYTPLAMP